MSSLEQLPDELLLEIVKHVKPCKASKTSERNAIYSSCLKDHTGREPLLLTLCLVSKKFLAIVEPILYSTLVIEAGHWRDFPRSYCIFSALLAKPARAGWVKRLKDMGGVGAPGGNLQGQYRSYNKHNEGRLEKILHCSHVQDWSDSTNRTTQIAQQFWNGDVLKAWVQCVWTQPGQALMALLVAMAPNLADLTLNVSTDRIPLLDLLRPTSDTQSTQYSLLASKKLVKLTLGPVIHHPQEYRRLDVYCQKTSSFLHQLRNLQYYHGQHEVCAKFLNWDDITLHENLRVLKLDKCIVPISRLASLVQHCPSLQDFTCFLGRGRADWVAHGQSLISALGSIQATLEILDLQLDYTLRRPSRYDEDSDDSDEDMDACEDVQEPSSFAHLRNLRSLTVPDCMLLGVLPGHDRTVNFQPALPMSHCLPRGIQYLGIRVYQYDLHDDSFSLWDLADDIQLFPALSTVEVLGTSRFATSKENCTSLVARFDMHEVELVLTCCTSESRIQASRAPHQVCAPLPSQRIMAQHHVTQSSSNEVDIQLAISSLNTNQIQSKRRAAATFNVPESTLRDRRAGRPARRDCQPNARKLT